MASRIWLQHQAVVGWRVTLQCSIRRQLYAAWCRHVPFDNIRKRIRVRAAVETHGGEEVKHTGDGIIAAFGSAVSAVEAALQIQRELAGAEVRVRGGSTPANPSPRTTIA